MTISNVSGKSLKKPLELKDFLPNYMDVSIEKSLEEQREDWANFKKKYMKVMKEAKREN